METAAEYDERLSVPIRWWAQGTMLVATLWLAVAVALPTNGIWAVTLLALLAMAALLVGYGAARITVRDGVLTAGRARISTRFLGQATALDAESTRLLAGRDADARAYLLIRPYLKESVRVDLTDPADPAPYWLLSTRQPASLVAALDSARPRPAVGDR